jgi:CBS domain-containing protein
MTIAAILGGKGHEVISVSGGNSVAEAVALLAAKRIGALPVMNGDTVVGIFSERDVIYCLERDGAAALGKLVSEVMTASPITAAPGESVLNALALMTKRRIRHLPVVENGRCVGFVSIGDLVKYRIDRIESEAEALRTYIQTA